MNSLSTRRRFALFIALVAAMLGATTSAPASEVVEPVCGRYGNSTCNCQVDSCSIVNGETRCTLYCKLRYIFYAE
jgi:hypothetical protein